MRKLIFTILVFSLLSSAKAFAGGGSKTTELKGKVTDRFGEPLIGAQIKITNTNQEVFTDFEGAFSIKQLPTSEQELKITHVSYVDKVVVIDLNNQSDKQLLLQLSSK